MEKLELDLDDLEVRSFRTSSTSGQEGTVHGMASPGCPDTYVGGMPCEDRDQTRYCEASAKYNRCTGPAGCGGSGGCPDSYGYVGACP
jgi:hypothetical protein